MAKVNPITGKWTGKLAGTVWAIRNGENIIRERNTNPFNPKSQAQVEVRAKLKLLSQLSAVCASVIAIPREGAVSSRNRFTSVNYGAVTYSDNQAQITATDIKLTNGVIGIPSIVVTRDAGNLNIRLGGSAGVGVDRMTYAILIKGKDNALRYAGVVEANTPDVSNTFPANFAMVDQTDTFIVLAYGIRFNTDSARIKYGDVQTVPAETIAKLIVTRVLLESDVTLTETRGVTSAPAQQSKEDEKSPKKK